VADGELDQHEVDQQQLRRVVVRVGEGAEFLLGGVDDEGVVRCELGEGWGPGGGLGG
jgi:hypothetical protein